MGSDWDAHFDYRMQGSSAIGTITERAGGHVRDRVIGRYGYERPTLAMTPASGSSFRLETTRQTRRTG